MLSSPNDDPDYHPDPHPGLDFRYVDTPLWVPELTGRSILTTEWVKGRHLRDLTEDEGLRMTTMVR